MYRANQGHLQNPLFSDLDHLSEKARRRLEESWAGVFYREFFCRLDEQPFGVLYAEVASRPNIPINVLVGLEALKAGFGWSDQELHDAFLFDVQVRYALGYRNLGEGEFDVRSIYNFRQRLHAHMGASGENLIERAFEQVTDEQISAFQLKTGSLRMDSTQIASNIRRSCRLQLLVEMLQRTYRMLSAADQAAYAAAFAPYLQGSSGQYVYHLKGQETEPHLQRIGELMARLLRELAPRYAEQATYQMLERVFAEQFDRVEAPASPDQASDEDASGPPAGSQPAAPPSTQPPALQPEADGLPSASTPRIQAKPGQAISPNSLRSPDDPEATYRKKGQRAYEGYVTHVTETCDPTNPLQLIVKVQTAPNTNEDASLLLEALPNLTQRTQLDTVYNDAGFCSPQVDHALRQAGIQQIPSALQGRAPDPRYTHLSDFEFQVDHRGQLTRMTCPHGHTLTPAWEPVSARYSAPVTDPACPDCRFRAAQARSALRFSQAELDLALRRQRCRAYHQSKPRLRAAIEATIGALKRPFNHDKTPVRGRFRVGLMMIGSAAMVNIRRMERYLLRQAQLKRQALAAQPTQLKADAPLIYFLSACWARCQHWLLPHTWQWPAFISGS
jgi:hypothetical protein